MARTRLAALAIPFLLLAACGGGDGGAIADHTTTTEAPVAAPAGLVSGGELTACSDTPYEPFEFQAHGVDTGYDIDLLRAVAKRANLDLVVKDLPFEGILGSLTAGDCDVVASAVTITAERKAMVDFSSPYFDADQSLLIKAADETTLTDLASLSGKTIGVQSGTTGETYAKEHAPHGATVKAFEDSDGLFAAIAAGDLDAILQDLPVNAYRATQEKTLKVVETYPTGEHYGFAVEKGNVALRTFVNEGLAALRSRGDFDTIYSKYFGDTAG